MHRHLFSGIFDLYTPITSRVDLIPKIFCFSCDRFDGLESLHGIAFMCFLLFEFIKMACTTLCPNGATRR